MTERQTDRLTDSLQILDLQRLVFLDLWIERVGNLVLQFPLETLFLNSLLSDWIWDETLSCVRSGDHGLLV